MKLTVALFEASCDTTTQLQVLQAKTALGLLVVSVNRYSVVAEAVGSARLEAVWKIVQHDLN